MLAFTIVLLLGILFRLIGINWDQGMHLHPDERMLIMVADRIHLFNQLDPDFFNYGSFPIYLLRAVYQIANFIHPLLQSAYDSMLPIGRLLSLSTDIGVIVLIYLLSMRLWRKQSISFFCAFVYAFSFFPIQNTHFFIVDTFLTFFLLLSFYLLTRYWQQPTKKKVLLLATSVGISVATKFSAVLFIPFALFFILVRSLYPKRRMKTALLHVILFILFTTCIHFLSMPYAYLHMTRFLSDITAQMKMNNDPYIFPYTLQYVGTTPYLYYLKNIFLWGLGPIASVLSLVGLVILVKEIYQYIRTWFHNKKHSHHTKKLGTSNLLSLLMILWVIFYFLILGRSAVKFMRYMLPLYPFLSLFAGYAVSKLFTSKHLHVDKLTTIIFRSLAIIFLSLLVLWTALLNSIYLKEHTRIAATRWILDHIPANSRLGVEHWDDRLPLMNSMQYQFNELQIYNQPDDASKWELIHNQLKNSDYLIIASNRLYTPLTKLGNCKTYTLCYPMTTTYYDDLFSGKIGFEQVAEFSAAPSIQLGNLSLEIDDQVADESFTVYDHPKIFIFKKK